MVETYEALRREAERQGCFEHRPLWSVLSFAAHIVASALFFWLSARSPHWALGVVCFVWASLLFYRIGWLMHDAAHGATFKGGRANRLFAAMTGGMLGGFPSGWRYGHNRHHAAPNVRGKDMDQAERWDPERRYKTLWGAAVGLLLFSKFRGKYLPKTLLLLGLRDGYFCYTHYRARFRAELLGSLVGFSVQLAWLIWCFGGWGVLLFFVHTSIGMLYLNTVFAGNHYDLESFDAEEAATIPFADLQIRTSRNYPGGVISHFIFGGLEYQIEHHLFPNMPRRGLRKVSPLVRAFCEARGLRYHFEPFSKCIMSVLRFHLHAHDEGATSSHAVSSQT